MNAVFHIAAAVGSLALIFLLIRQGSQLRLLRALLDSLREADGGRGRRVVAAPPVQFLKQFSAALLIPAEIDGGARVPVRRIEPRPWVELFVRQGISLIRYQEMAAPAAGGAEVEVVVSGNANQPGLEGELGAALGGALRVRLVQGPQREPALPAPKE